jgi:hypothetical protein
MNFVTVIDEYDEDVDGTFRKLLNLQLDITDKNSEWQSLSNLETLDTDTLLLKQQVKDCSCCRCELSAHRRHRFLFCCCRMKKIFQAMPIY